jgi:predicted DNA-binding transcriptional regulator YafY
MKRLQRLYKLLMLIRTHDMLAEHLAKALECSLSQVEKDIAYLRDIGVHIAYSKIERTYYSKTRPSELIDMFAVMIEQYD